MSSMEPSCWPQFFEASLIAQSAHWRLPEPMMKVCLDLFFGGESLDRVTLKCSAFVEDFADHPDGERTNKLPLVQPPSPFGFSLNE